MWAQRLVRTATGSQVTLILAYLVLVLAPSYVSGLAWAELRDDGHVSGSYVLPLHGDHGSYGNVYVHAAALLVMMVYAVAVFPLGLAVVVPLLVRWRSFGTAERIAHLVVVGVAVLVLVGTLRVAYLLLSWLVW